MLDEVERKGCTHTFDYFALEEDALLETEVIHLRVRTEVELAGHRAALKDLLGHSGCTNVTNGARR